MKKQIALTLISLFVGFSAMAQYPVKTIQEVQTVSPTNLQAGIDASPFLETDTIRVRGVVVMDAGLSTLQNGRQIWIQVNDGSPFSGIDIFQNHPSGTDDGGTGILDLVAGDSVEITGTILEFQGETELIPVNTSPVTPIQLLGSGITVKSKLINAADLNDPQRNNIMTTGEQWEGMYVELQNVTVASVDYFSNGARVSFNVTDAAGNRVNVSDRFISQRLPATGGTFVPPNVGDFITSIKGVIAHSKNVRGYELFPFQSTDIVYGASAPAISGITRNFVVPSNTDQVIISANITDGNGIRSASVYYAVGATSQNYIKVPMTASGNIYTATLPVQAEGSFVKYFVEARDNSADSLLSRIPNVPTEDPRFYVVRNGALTIYDIQYTPFRNANSGFVDLPVTVSGVVTASSGDLGFVYIQQENQTSWAGLPLVGSTALATLVTGDRVTVTGTVKEYFGLTRLEAITNVTKTGTGTITPLLADVDSFRVFSLTGTEPFEGMLLKFTNPGKSLYIVNTNADAPSNFAEYRVGKDTSDAGAGCRVLAGRVTSTAFSSLNVSYVNDSIWVPNLGVNQIIVQKGDSMTSLTGIMTYGFSNFKLLPRNNADFENYSTAVGINSKYANKGKAIAYPNPSAGNLAIDYILPAEAKNINVQLYNMLGQAVSAPIELGVSGTQELNVTQLPAGQYLYRISSSNLGVLNVGRISIVK